MKSLLLSNWKSKLALYLEAIMFAIFFYKEMDCNCNDGSQPLVMMS